MLNSSLSLDPYGRPAAVMLHTAGHTPESMSVLFPNGDVLAGDLAIGGVSVLGGIARLGHARKPPFEEN